MVDQYKVIKNPLSKEKIVRLIEKENKLLFVVDREANKEQIREAIQSLFKVKVLKVNTLFTRSGEKRAYVKLSLDTPAIDIMTQMGMM